MSSLSHVPSFAVYSGSRYSKSSLSHTPAFTVHPGSSHASLPMAGHEQTSKLCPRCHTHPPFTVYSGLGHSKSPLSHAPAFAVHPGSPHVFLWLDTSKLQSYVLIVTRVPLHCLLRVTALKVTVVTRTCLHHPPWVTTRKFSYGRTRTDFKVMSSLSHMSPFAIYPGSRHSKSPLSHAPTFTQICLWPDTSRLQSYVLVVNTRPLHRPPGSWHSKSPRVGPPFHGHERHEQSSNLKLCPRCQNTRFFTLHYYL